MSRRDLRSFLRQRANSIPAGTQERYIDEAQERYPEKSTFLAHYSRDANILPAIIEILEQHGASVYIDKADKELPPETSADTARQLKIRIQQCRNFVVVASNNSKKSRWIPWELALADGFKGREKAAIFPVPGREKEKNWYQQEYLGLYRRIAMTDSQRFMDDDWEVLDPDNGERFGLRDWLAA